MTTYCYIPIVDYKDPSYRYFFLLNLNDLQKRKKHCNF